MNEQELIKQYLHALENPTNSGFSAQTQTWGRGRFDRHQFQDGLDDRNDYVSNYLKQNNTDSIPKQDADSLQQLNLNRLDIIWNNHTKDKKISPLKKR